jgi:hypothetical protein
MHKQSSQNAPLYVSCVSVRVIDDDDDDDDVCVCVCDK